MISSLNADWKTLLNEEFEKDYMKNLHAFLEEEKRNGLTIYPIENNIFNALNLTSFQDVKVVILGQDPYHGLNQAHGLSFSVQDGIKIPPSLKNIYKELHSDIEGFKIPEHGNLQHWAEQGVLLLNATLTVRAAEAGSHQNQGWEIFTDKIIQLLSEQKEHLVFILWGKYAQQKITLIDQSKHAILASAHPSPFSAYNGFLGSKPFSKTNELLEKQGITSINWHLKKL
ncbi:uracil-DNA glycosylase [Pedobacter sp. MW01-1-1]|uniref:uracil-DNA glycosylase n=1 Tax=Pedobacter sp. MW01-1-1 TaxID=3383027 RepID=UPI003FEFCBD6